jgi:hypothetical protein
MQLAAFVSLCVTASGSWGQDTVNVSDVQVMLNFTGHLKRPGFGGKIDDDTRAALRSFAQTPTGELDRAVLARLTAASKRSRERVGFRTHADSATDVEIGIPSALVSGPTATAWGMNWRAADRSIDIDTLAIPLSRHSIESLHSTLANRPGRTLTISRVESGEFLIEGEDAREGNSLRVYATLTSNMIRGYSIVYRSNRSSDLLPVVNAVSSAFVADPRATRPTYDLREQQMSPAAKAPAAPSPETHRPQRPEVGPSPPETPRPSASPTVPIVTASYQTLTSLLQRIVDDNEGVIAFHVGSREIDPRTGRVTLELTKTVLTDGSSEEARSAPLAGDAFNLLPIVDRRNPKQGHLAFHRPDMGRSIVLFTVSRQDEAALRNWAQGVQADLDRLAQMTGRTTDPLASLKVFRQGR